MKDILVARNELAATFTNSEVGRSARIHGIPAAISDSYTLRNFASA